jgi:hypothetical protein
VRLRARYRFSESSVIRDEPDIIVDSIAALCDPDRLLHEVLPTMNREDDTPQNIHDWVAAHS